jgi:hypothetical protein
MSMHLGFSCVQNGFKTRLGADRNLLRFFRLFWNVFSFFSSYFYLFEGSKIFLLSSKYFVGLFVSQFISRNFLEFLGFFRAFSVLQKNYLVFSWIFLCTENDFMKKREILSYQFGPSPKARPALLRPKGKPARQPT